MGMRLILYLGILVLGGFVGYKDKISEKLEANLDTIQSICLLFLLFVMGITIGINEEVMTNLFSIGLKAFIISIFTILFSIVFVYIIKRFIVLEEERNES
ncbi:LysO family transporter [Tissierella sp. MB52-C2]|jgi:uncharacterized membrane protein YbjE (DUF340 family)|uniref:LysO family transporter n=1 Tax=Tissierella sp. MB52-C2 TaxID=3070999 RepID=UPI00280AF1A7|nr:LysO family transporter [Tissierella sp. MB52-C2]WMM23261.1 LysO family transporter [Tissierella sp. MB52-C2]